MKSYLAVVIICLATVIPSKNFAQTVLSDSLREVIDNHQLSDGEKPTLLNQLAEIYRINKNYKAAEARARQSASIALQQQNFTDASKAYTLLVDIRINSQQYEHLNQVSDSALALAKKANNPVAMAYGYYAQVLLFKMLDNGEEVVRFCNHGLKALEKVDDPFIAAKLYYRLYAVYSGWNNVARVNNYARKATENALRTKDYNLISNSYMALSIAHEYNFNAAKEPAQLDSTFYYLNRVEALYQQYPGQVANVTYAIACINLANCYLKYYPEKDMAAEAKGIQYAHTAGELLKRVTSGEEIAASSLGILSEYAGRKGNAAQQEAYLLEAYSTMKTQQPPVYYHTMINIVQALAFFYEHKGNSQKALDFQKKVSEYTSKNFDQKQALNAQKLEIQYETEKRTNEMRVLKEQEKSRRLQNYVYGYIALAAMLGLILMFLFYHLKVRNARQREKQLYMEKAEASLQIKLQQEEQARLKAEQQLLEVQQQQLKKEVMANVLQLEHKNQTLINLKHKLAEGEKVNIQRIIKEEMVLDNDFEQAKLQVQQVHQDFFHLLNEKAQKKLTQLDLKFCAYQYLKMDTGQIAKLMNIEAKSVRMYRYRIKQKLGLDKDDDLNSFLQQLGK
jgi:hypothetical protein